MVRLAPSQDNFNSLESDSSLYTYFGIKKELVLKFLICFLILLFLNSRIKTARERFKEVSKLFLEQRREL